MYQVKTEGIGKLVCNCDGCTPLTDSLSQAKLKRLFTLNCEFIEYVEQQKGKASESKQSTNSEYPTSGKQNKKNNGVSTSGRKQNARKGRKKSNSN
jgi:hypothetical protein